MRPPIPRSMPNPAPTAVRWSTLAAFSAVGGRGYCSSILASSLSRSSLQAPAMRAAAIIAFAVFFLVVSALAEHHACSWDLGFREPGNFGWESFCVAFCIARNSVRSSWAVC